MTDQTEKKPRASRRKKVEEQDTTVIELPAATSDQTQTESEAEDRANADENEVLELPVLPLRGTVVFPLTVVPLAAAQARSLRLIDEVMSGDRTVALVMQKDAELEGAGPDDVYDVGTISTIHQMMRVPDGTVRLAVQGNERMRVLEFIQEEPYLIARVQRAPEIIEESVEVEALTRNTLTSW
jgi:ATP-dependent Lon protease